MTPNPYLPNMETSKAPPSSSKLSKRRYNPYLIQKARLDSELEQNFLALQHCICQIKAIEAELNNKNPLRARVETEQLITAKEGLRRMRDEYGTERKQLHEEDEKLEQRQKRYKERKAAELQRARLSENDRDVTQEAGRAEGKSTQGGKIAWQYVERARGKVS